MNCGSNYYLLLPWPFLGVWLSILLPFPLWRWSTLLAPIWQWGLALTEQTFSNPDPSPISRLSGLLISSYWLLLIFQSLLPGFLSWALPYDSLLDLGPILPYPLGISLGTGSFPVGRPTVRSQGLPSQLSVGLWLVKDLWEDFRKAPWPEFALVIVAVMYAYPFPCLAFLLLVLPRLKKEKNISATPNSGLLLY